jgi:hypothetical protein
VIRARGPTPRAARLGDADRAGRRELVVAVGNLLGLSGVPAPLPADVAGRTGQSTGLPLVDVIAAPAELVSS